MCIRDRFGDMVTGGATLEPFVETEQVTQEDIVEEIYTLPEDSKVAKKDFQIIDNRNKKKGWK